ncbi:MAG: DUF1634 domain-containing protein [Parachlamydiaceae bacterium]
MIKPNNDIEHTSLDIILSRVLQCGLVISLLATLSGGILLLWQRGGETVDYKIFVGAPVDLRNVLTIVYGAFQGNALALTQLGILMMIITPTIRVLACVILFACQRDRLYVILSAFVLVILVLGLTFNFRF